MKAQFEAVLTTSKDEELEGKVGPAEFYINVQDNHENHPHWKGSAELCGLDLELYIAPDNQHSHPVAVSKEDALETVVSEVNEWINKLLSDGEIAFVHKSQVVS